MSDLLNHNLSHIVVPVNKSQKAFPYYSFHRSINKHLKILPVSTILGHNHENTVGKQIRTGNLNFAENRQVEDCS